jgi:hypothetical protein
MSTAILPKVTVVKDQLEFGKTQPVTSANLIARLTKGTVLQVSDADLSKIGTANQWLKVVDSLNRTGFVNAAGVSTSLQGQTGTSNTNYIDLSGQSMKTATVNSSATPQNLVDLSGQPMKAAPSLPTYADPKFIDLSNQAQGEEMGDELV